MKTQANGNWLWRLLSVLVCVVIVSSLFPWGTFLGTGGLLTGLSDPDNSVRCAALRSLERSTDVELVVPALLRHYLDSKGKYSAISPLVQTVLVHDSWLYSGGKTLSSQFAARLVLFRMGDPARKVVTKYAQDPQLGPAARGMLAEWTTGVYW
jgi:hypothetical protein